MIYGFQNKSPWKVCSSIQQIKGTRVVFGVDSHTETSNVLIFTSLKALVRYTNTNSRISCNCLLFDTFENLQRVSPLVLLDDEEKKPVSTVELTALLGILIVPFSIRPLESIDHISVMLDETKDGCLNSVLNFLYSISNLKIRARHHDFMYKWFCGGNDTDSIKAWIADSFKKPTTSSSLFLTQVTANHEEFERFRQAVNHYQKENDYEMVSTRYGVPLNDIRYVIITTEKLKNAA